jgi:hypothetical protein
MAARRKRQTSMDSPDLSSRPAEQNGSQQSHEDLVGSSAVPAARSVEQLADSNSLNVANIGSAHSLVELGSSGGLPALPVEASESRVPAHRSAPEPEPILIERKRSASLGGEAILQQMTDVSSVSGAEASLGSCSGGAESLEQVPSGEFRSRTSSGSFVTKNYVHPIDAAGIRSYCGLSAFTQERIRRFEQVQGNSAGFRFFFLFNSCGFNRKRKLFCSAIWHDKRAVMWTFRDLTRPRWRRRGSAPKSKWKRMIYWTLWLTILPVKATNCPSSRCLSLFLFIFLSACFF